MRYILNPNIALRSWQLVPYAFYVKGERNARGLKKEEFDFLSACDGKTEFPNEEKSPLVEKFLAAGFISKAEKGETLSEWSKPKVCDNRYFPAMNLMITGKCNYNCLHCFNAADNAPLMSEWSLPDAEKLLDDARDCGINAFTITGGEPMCHKNFFEIIEGIYARGMFVEELNTNGYYITRETLEKMRKIGCEPLIKISFDGLGYHDWLRNRMGAEEDSLRAIKLCVENGFRVKVQTNVHKKNVESILPTAEMLDSVGVDEMRIIRTTEAPRWNANANGLTLGLEEYYEKMLDILEKYSKGEHNMSIDTWQFVSVFPRYGTYRLRPVECCEGEYRATVPVCRGNRGMIAVAADGNVFPCLQMSGYYEEKGDILGNVKTDGLKKLLCEGPYLSEVCATVSDLALINKKCGNCRFFKYCAGGCRAVALALTGDKMGSDPAKCLFYNNGWYGKVTAALSDMTNLTPVAIED